MPLTLTLLSAFTLMLPGCSTKYANDNAHVSPVEVKYDAYYGKPERNKGAVHTTARTAKGSSSTTPFRKNAPTRYVVKKGDTLWRISRLFLKDPSYWPEIWDKNQKVRNPHRIFPGDILYIHHGKTSAVSKGNGTKLIPTIRITRKGTGEPISTLAPFLAWPRVANKDDLSSAPYIVAARDATLLLEKDKTVYLKGLAHSQRGDTYGVYHVGKELRDIETNELLGTEISYHGQVAIVHPDDITTATIENSNREIRAGDRVIKVNPNPRALSMPIIPPSNKVRGTIMNLYDADIISGQHMIVVVNRGQRDGLRPGHILGVYSPPRLAKDPYQKRLDKWHSKQAIEVKLPPERVGSMIVYS
ncbi:MAG: LysM peptidoglycan-binding domain-containing protein, partial [Thiotrichaceae bacterium]